METLLTKSLAERDRATVWHPFVQAKLAPDPIALVRGEGAYLYTENGTRLIDAISSWWVNLHGHAHPYIAAKISAQLTQLEHAIFTDYTHPQGVELAERLLALAPGAMNKVFYTDNGSTAVEVALKMALQYWTNHDSNTVKTKIVSLVDGYHGDTFGSMTAAGKNHFNKPFWPYLFHVEKIVAPTPGFEEIAYQQLTEIIKKGEVACFIFEPLVQGAGGMRMHTPAALDRLIGLCRAQGVLTIADEVMTGFGRTGTLFACDTLTHPPDILCLSKGITGGFLPLGATLCTEQIYNAFYSSDRAKTLYHSHSYTGNPLACTAGLASLDLLEGVASKQQRQMLATKHREFIREWGLHPSLRRCEAHGTILALEYAQEEESSYYSPLKERLYRYFLAQGILTRPLGNVLYLLPPYCISESDLNQIYHHISVTLTGDTWKNY